MCIRDRDYFQWPLRSMCSHPPFCLDVSGHLTWKPGNDVWLLLSSQDLLRVTSLDFLLLFQNIFWFWVTLDKFWLRTFYTRMRRTIQYNSYIWWNCLKTGNIPELGLELASPATQTSFGVPSRLSRIHFTRNKLGRGCLQQPVLCTICQVLHRFWPQPNLIRCKVLGNLLPDP